MNDPLGLFEDDANNDPLGLFSEEPKQDTPILNEVTRRVKAGVGGVDAALSMAATIPAYAAGGLYGLGTLLSGQGIDKSVENMRKVGESNFGLGAPKPITKEGQEVNDMVADLTEGAIGKVNEGVAKVAGDKAGNLAAFGAEMALNLAPIPGFKGVKKIAKKLEKQPPVKTGGAADVIAEAKAKQEGLAGKPLDIDLSEGPGTGEGAIMVNRKGTARVPNENPGLTEGYNRAEAEALKHRANELSQQELFDQPEQGRVANETEAVLGDWRIDENGMPIKADLSMEAQNLENPLQRNLWGDEMPMVRNTVGQGADLFARSEPPVNDVPLTAAIDSMPPGPAREAAIARLQHDIEAPGALERAKLDAEINGPFDGDSSLKPGVPFNFKKQGGAINVAAINEAFDKMRSGVADAMDYVKSFVGTFNPNAWNAIMSDLSDPKSRSTIVLMTPAEFHRLAAPRDPRLLKEYGPDKHTDIRGALKSSKGLRDIPYLQTEMDGNGVARVVGHEGRHRMDVFKEMGIEQVPVIIRDRNVRWGTEPSLYDNPHGFPKALRPEKMTGPGGDRPFPMPLTRNMPENRGPYVERIKSPGNRQMGGIYMGAEPTKPTRKGPTPEEIADKQQQARVAKLHPKAKALDEFTNVTSKEEAIALSKDVKDISPDFGQKQLGSGIGFHAAMSNSPALKYARYVYREARIAADQFSHRFITDNKKGITPLWSKMTDQERVGTMEALFEGDKQQFRVTDEVMDKLNFTDKQRQFVKTFYEADESMWQNWVSKLEANGLKVPKKREGHFPGIFVGSYKTLVMIPKMKDGVMVKDKNGAPVYETAGVIAVDTAIQRKMVEKWFKEKYPDARMVQQARSGLSGSSPRYYSNIFSGMNDILDMLGKEDPRFAEVQELVRDAIVEANNKLFNFNVHELNKKGVIGNEGNRPWKDAKTNANDAFHALVRYFEEGALHHELQIPLKDMRDLANSPDMQHLPNTLKYLDKYTKKVTGADLNQLGAILNSALDLPFKILGVGPGVPLKVTGAIKNNMSQLFMGYGNWMFTVSQLVQPGQTGLPFMQLAATRLGMDMPSAVKSMADGGTYSMLAFAEEKTGHRIDVLPEHMRAAYKYARERGLLVFSEIERAYQGTQGRVSRAKDRAAEANMKLGETATRTPMFMAFTDLLVKGGVPLESAMPIAEHMTQFSMVDYHQWERPMLYSGLGVTGQFAGGLQTFKHGVLSQQTYLAKQAIKPAVGDRQVKPIMLSIAAALALAGVTGLPGYEELDGAVMYLTDKFGDGAKSIREIALSNTPEWLNSGIVSNVTELNIQNKFSAADMVGDSFAKTFSPHLEAFSKIVADAIEVAKTGDSQAVRNLLMQITPSGLKGFTESAVARDEQNRVIGRDGKPIVERSEKDWDRRKLTGMRPHQEAIERETTWTARIKERKDIERKKEIVVEYERRLVNNTLDDKARDKLQQEYQDRGGELSTLIELHKKVPVEMNQTQKQRMEGVPKSAGGVKRWEYYNR
jgi:hypothetical protein